MGKEIMVNCSELQKKSKRIIDKLQIYDTQLKHLYTDCLIPLETAWESRENLAYISNFDDYLSDLKELENSIKNYAELLQIAASKYKEAQSETVSYGVGTGAGGGGGSSW
ncbi:MAG: hypothetical protein NC124_12045 [Clostridium sp.]|nr:hypothetical protein [Clostridium sp.]